MASTDGLQLDEVLTSLKPWGKWQLRQIVSQLMICFPASYFMLSFVIVAAYPVSICNVHQLDVSSTNRFGNYSESQFGVVGKPTHLRPFFNQSVDGNSELVHEDHCKFMNSSSGEVTSCTHGYSYNIPRDQSIIAEWDLVCNCEYLSGLSQTMFTVGQALGTIVFMYLADRYGRRKVFLINISIAIAMSAATSLSPSITVFILLRLATGFFQSVTMLVGVIMLEIVPVLQRTYLALWGNLMWALALTTFSGVGYLCRNLNWRYTQLALSAPQCVFIVMNMLVLDESVRWLWANGRYKSIKRIIEKAAKINGRQDHPSVKSCVAWCDEKSENIQVNPSAELHNISKKMEDSSVTEDSEQFIKHEIKETESITQNAAKYSSITLVRHPRLRRMTAVLCCVWVMNGWIYLGLLLTSSALAGDIYMNLFLNTVIEIPGGIITYLCLRWIGRRYTCVLFNGIAALALAISCSIQIASGSSGSPVITAFSIIGKFGNSVAFGSMFTYTPELFPTNLRSLGLGLAGTASRVGGMVAPYSMLLIQAIPWLPAMLYSVASVICCVIILLLPETRDKSLPQTIEDIEIWYIQPNPKQNQQSVPEKTFKIV